jgi:hypothetical protein|eukprot:CAMPEP_0170467268 /NCGR_PEP_ID=MMETSP0123-20130129/10908_1 /TAXON_ID=182087 /ORGANISM="Favella ehrenbergii, Strain Fehren 1" /LENGTH=49 /DNA_ID=CAMNT_0010733587 /DNA_START=1113 /DNA_END=1262 /DNA_ORIENTATION=+
MEERKRKRQAELEAKDMQEQEELAKKQLHKPGVKVGVNDFKKAYNERME